MRIGTARIRHDDDHLLDLSGAHQLVDDRLHIASTDVAKNFYADSNPIGQSLVIDNITYILFIAQYQNYN